MRKTLLQSYELVLFALYGIVTMAPGLIALVAALTLLVKIIRLTILWTWSLF
jgi:hypothetical protein